MVGAARFSGVRIQVYENSAGVVGIYITWRGHLSNATTTTSIELTKLSWEEDGTWRLVSQKRFFLLEIK